MLDLISRFQACRALVVGDALLDSYLDGYAERLSREGPAPIVRVSTRSDCPGGAANVAANLAALGCEVRFVSVVGADDKGTRLAELLQDRGVRSGDFVVDPARRTPCLQRVRAGGQLLARLDERSPLPVADSLQQGLIERINKVTNDCDLVVVSDYETGVLTDVVVDALEAQRGTKVVVVDAKNLVRYGRLRPTAVKPNWSEALGVLDSLDSRDISIENCDRPTTIARFGDTIVDKTHAAIAAVTLDQDGAVIIEGGHPPYRTFTTPRDPARAAGAGDSFLASFALGLACGANPREVADLATSAATVVINRDLTTACTGDELEAQLLGGLKVLREDSRLLALVQRIREDNKRIVFTNGCFDLLHRGHISYLERAKSLGDILMVGLNADDSVRALKGPDRPINPLEDRIQVLVALGCVDHVVPFDTPTPERLLKLVRPDDYAKGGDYTRETLPEADLLQRLGIKIEFLPIVEDHSTTGIIDRILDHAAAS